MGAAVKSSAVWLDCVGSLDHLTPKKKKKTGHIWKEKPCYSTESNSSLFHLLIVIQAKTLHISITPSGINTHTHVLHSLFPALLLIREKGFFFFYPQTHSWKKSPLSLNFTVSFSGESNVKYFVWIPFTKIKCLHATLADRGLHM